MQIGNKSRLRKDEWNTLVEYSSHNQKKPITNKIRLNVNKFVSTMTSKISFEIFNIHVRENYNANSVCCLSQCINLIKIGSLIPTEHNALLRWIYVKILLHKKHMSIKRKLTVTKRCMHMHYNIFNLQRCFNVESVTTNQRWQHVTLSASNRL